MIELFIYKKTDEYNMAHQRQFLNFLLQNEENV